MRRRFPQPKLPAARQWRPPAPAELSLEAVYLLQPGGGEVEARRLSRRAAALALVRQTVAARLFGAELQARHLEFCIELSRRVPVRALFSERRAEALPRLLETIAGDGR